MNCPKSHDSHRCDSDPYIILPNVEILARLPGKGWGSIQATQFYSIAMLCRRFFRRKSKSTWRPLGVLLCAFIYGSCNEYCMCHSTSTPDMAALDIQLLIPKDIFTILEQLCLNSLKFGYLGDDSPQLRYPMVI